MVWVPVPALAKVWEYTVILVLPDSEEYCTAIMPYKSESICDSDL